MYKTLIVLPGGTELSSGAGKTNAIQSVTITECVNGAQDLILGSCCANMIEAKLLTPSGGVSIKAGDELAVYRVDDNGKRYKVGLFTTENPTRPSANTLSITAYDRISKLDKDLTQWLAGLKNWPYTLITLASMVCVECGLELANTSLPNGSHQVQKFSADGITGRQLMQWIGEATGRFCRATPDGLIEFAWYKESEYSISADGKNASTYYYQNSLSFADYSVEKIKKVQIRQGENDVGTVYPANAGSGNTYIVGNNYLLTAESATALTAIAQTLYTQLKDVTYIPCKVSIPATLSVHAGDIVEITDVNGKSVTAFVMTKTTTGQRDTLECTGTHTRNSSTAVNSQTFKALNGKVLNLKLDVDGLSVANANTQGQLAELSLDVSGIKTKVSDIDGLANRVSVIEQKSDSISISVTGIQNQVTTVNSNVSTLQTDVAGVKTDIGTVQGDVSAVQGQVNTVNSNVSTLQTDVSTVKGDVGTLQTDVTNAQTDIENVQGDVTYTKNQVATMQVDLSGIKTSVSAISTLETKVSEIDQKADEIQISVTDIQNNGVSKVQNSFGLTIDQSAVRIHRSTSDMTNKLDENGMYIVRDEGKTNETTMLKADSKGVVATDVSVRNYLVLGNYARFEDYDNGTDSKRTACFWTGG